MGPESGHCRCACVSSINLPENRYTRTAACCSKIYTVLVYNIAQRCLSNHNIPHTQQCLQRKNLGTRTTGGAALVAGAALKSAAAHQKQKVYVAAVVTAARHTGSEPVQCRCACVSSINLLKIGILVHQHAAAKNTVLVYNVAQQCLSNKKRSHTQ